MTEERDSKTPDPNDRRPVYILIGFGVLLSLIALMGWLTNPS